MAGEFKGYLAALAWLQSSSLTEGVNKGGKVLIPLVEYVPVGEFAYPVRGDGDSSGFILELNSLLHHPRMENVGIAGKSQIEAYTTTDIYGQTASIDKLVLNCCKEVEELVGLDNTDRSIRSLIPER